MQAIHPCQLAITLAGAGMIAGSAGLALAAAVVPAGTASAATLPSNCMASGTTVTCTFSPGPEGTFVVPAGVNSVHVVATGQGGGSALNGRGGPGAQVTADLSVTPGSTLFVEAAIGGGAGVTGGRAGGGESDVRTCSITDASCPKVGTAQDPRLIVAGGGSGGAAGVGSNTCNAGTNGGDAILRGTPISFGGMGGSCTSGGTGGAGEPGSGGGGNGTASSGGDSGAAGGGANGSGGGGGAGFFGGGGGGGGRDGAGGGGGSSSGPAGSVFATATTGPQVTISYRAPAPDLSLTDTAPGSAVSGQPYSYSLTATNTGGADATGTVVTDTLPAQAHFDSAATSQGSCTRAPGTSLNKTKGGTVTCTMGTLASEASVTVTITVTPTKPGAYSDAATVTASNVTGDSDDTAAAPVTAEGN